MLRLSRFLAVRGGTEYVRYELREKGEGERKVQNDEEIAHKWAIMTTFSLVPRLLLPHRRALPPSDAFPIRPLLLLPLPIPLALPNLLMQLIQRAAPESLAEHLQCLKRLLRVELNASGLEGLHEVFGGGAEFGIPVE